MASKQTQNIHLCQWEPDDEILRADFNSDNAKLDAAIAGKADAGSVTALTQAVNAKAAASAVTALAGQVSGLAAKFGPDNLPWVTGTYTGTGGAPEDAQEIVLGFRPKLVIVAGEYGSFGLGVSCGGMGYCSSSYTAAFGVEFSEDGLSLTDDGFRVQEHNSSSGQSMNVQARKYVYFALR